MKANKRQRTDYIFFLGLLVLNLISLALLSFFVYRFFFIEEVKAFGEKTRAGLVKECRAALDDIDLQIQTMLEIPGLYFTENSYNQTLLKPQTENIISSPSDVNSLCSMLFRIQKTYPYLESMDVYYEGSSIAVTDFAHIHEIASDEDISTFIPWYKKLSQMNDKSTFLPLGMNRYLSGRPVISYIYSVRNTAWDGKHIYIALHFSSDVFNLPRLGFEISSAVLSSDGRLLFRYNMNEWQLEEAKHIREQGEIRIRDWSLYQKISDSTGLIYSAFTSPSISFRVSSDNARIQRNFAVLIVSCVLILIMLTIFSYYIYKRYIDSFSNDVGLASKGSLSNTLTGMKDMIESLDSQSRSFKEQSALRALLLNRADKDAYNAFYDSAEEDYILSVILESESEIPLDDIKRLCTYADSEGRVLYTVFSSPIRIMLVFLLKNDSFDSSVLDRIRSSYPDVLIDVGMICALRANGFQNSYASAMDVYKYRFMDGKNQVLFNKELALEEKKAFGNHIGILSDIENFIQLEQKDTAESLIDRLFDDLESGGYTVQYVTATLGDLVSAIYGIIVQNHLDMWSLFGYDIRNYSSKRIRYIDEYRRWLKSAALSVIDALLAVHEGEADELPIKIEHLIEENLENDISLGMLAEKLNMREDALSRAFPALMGCNYIEYVTEKKLRKAVELLYEGMPVQDISSYLGYRSPQYFIRIFKNAYGMTPHKFRNSRKKKEE